MSAAAAGRRAVRRGRLRRVAALAIVLAIAFGLKVHYRDADADGLAWVLAPTAGAVAVLTGTDFELEPHRGYLSRERRYEILPSCAGVNFMVVAMVCVALALTLAPRAPGVVATIAVSTSSAYIVTLAANATRIVIAMRLHEAGVIGELTPERLHRIAGVAVYFVFLMALWQLAQRAAGVRIARTA